MKDATSGQEGGVKHDTGKPRWDLIPLDILEDVVRVFTFGAEKYGDHNWRAGMRWQRPLAACLRHLTQWQGGQDRDLETGLSHLAHATCCLIFMMWYQKHGKGEDDRWTNVKASRLAHSPQA